MKVYVILALCSFGGAIVGGFVGKFLARCGMG